MQAYSVTKMVSGKIYGGWHFDDIWSRLVAFGALRWQSEWICVQIWGQIYRTCRKWFAPLRIKLFVQDISRSQSQKKLGSDILHLQEIVWPVSAPLRLNFLCQIDHMKRYIIEPYVYMYWGHIYRTRWKWLGLFLHLSELNFSCPKYLVT